MEKNANIHLSGGHKIEQETGKYQWLQELTSGASVLEVLTILTRTMSGFDDVQTDDLSIEGKDIRLHGRAASFKTVDRLKQEFIGMKVLKTVRLLDAKMDKKEKMVKFNFVLEKL